MLWMTAAWLLAFGPGDFEAARRDMTRHQIRARGVEDPRVLAAMAAVERHRFVPERYRDRAYDDGPLPIGHGQTISQPYIVAAMTELLQVGPDDKVLEVGTGSGYQAAVLSQIVRQVFTVEIVTPLAQAAKATLAETGCDNVVLREGDGYHGWPERAPFDAIIVTAAASHIPPPLIEQLKPGGRMVIPVGPVYAVQHLMLIEKREDGSVVKKRVMAVRFVPLTGEH